MLSRLLQKWKDLDLEGVWTDFYLAVPLQKTAFSLHLKNQCKAWWFQNKKTKRKHDWKHKFHRNHLLITIFHHPWNKKVRNSNLLTHMFKKRDLSLPVPRKFNGQNQEQIQKMFGLSLHLSNKKKVTLHTFNGKNCTRAFQNSMRSFWVSYRDICTM